jgi:hypothetical protein
MGVKRGLLGEFGGSGSCPQMSVVPRQLTLWPMWSQTGDVS